MAGPKSDPRSDEKPVVRIGDVVLFNEGGVDCAAHVFHVTSPENGIASMRVWGHDGSMTTAREVRMGTEPGQWRHRAP